MVLYLMSKSISVKIDEVKKSTCLGAIGVVKRVKRSSISFAVEQANYYLVT